MRKLPEIEPREEGQLELGEEGLAGGGHNPVESGRVYELFLINKRWWE